ncbi:hypothetical protein [uncultured Phascolarctobacterium sp.]|uniref:hypothetical protein n=1 Tax=Phascolarctobacterium sp. TaxID=2049039 RepID=UPI0025FB5C97|nr:hypothetical protein [uncultured Phascolarctobacterium sp.]
MMSEKLTELEKNGKALKDDEFMELVSEAQAEPNRGLPLVMEGLKFLLMKLRLLDVWVQRYGAVEAAVFLAAVRRVAAGRYFPRFCDLDAALAEEQRARRIRTGPGAAARQAAPVDREGNQRRVRELIERLAQRGKQL